MRGRILLFSYLILLIQVAQVESNQGYQVNGYLGDSVTLPSRGNTSWKLSIIKWSVFPNNTFIATYRNYTKNTDHFSRYKGRLDLNTSSGDLTIRNLNRDDDMEYTAVLINTEKRNIVNKIKLTVLKHLQKPTINTISSKSTEGGCWIWLRCTSPEEGVVFSWEVKPVSVLYTTNRDGVLSAILSTQTNITCISSKNNETASSSVSPKCNERKPPPQPHHRDRIGLHFVIALVATSILMLIPIIPKGGDGITSKTGELEVMHSSGADQELSEKLCPTESSSSAQEL